MVYNVWSIKKPWPLQYIAMYCDGQVFYGSDIKGINFKTNFGHLHNWIKSFKFLMALQSQQNIFIFRTMLIFYRRHKLIFSSKVKLPSWEGINKQKAGWGVSAHLSVVKVPLGLIAALVWAGVAHGGLIGLVRKGHHQYAY